MENKIDYCWAKAVEYSNRAEQATDPEVREFFRRLRDSWIGAANRAEAAPEAQRMVAAPSVAGPGSLRAH